MIKDKFKEESFEDWKKEMKFLNYLKSLEKLREYFEKYNIYRMRKD